MACNASVSLKLWSAFLKIKNVIIIIVTNSLPLTNVKKLNKLNSEVHSSV